MSSPEYNRAWRESHREHIAAYDKARGADAARRDALAGYQRKYRQNKCRELEEYFSSYRDEHKEERAEYQKAYRLTEHGRAVRHRCHYRRYARRTSALGIDYTTADMIVARCELWGNKCYICGGPMEAVDHVKPLAKGGAHLPCNLRPICKPCNSGKKDKWPYLFTTA